MGSKLLEINHMKKGFDGKGVLEDISLTVEEGEVVSIIGPSGSGKSTLLRCATMLEQMDGGELIYQGQRAVWEKTDKKGIRKALLQAVQRHSRAYPDGAYGGYPPLPSHRMRA